MAAQAKQVSTTRTWWKESIVYQIYPASFKDTNGDGLGDITGIISKMDYIASLGVDAILLSPIFASPQKDMGYDISDYREIYPPYGTVADVDKLILGLHARGVKVLLDLVVNHTSDQHMWFKESRKSRESANRDWYFWRDAKYAADGTRKPPNNWASIFGGSAWHWDEESQQYYLALFLPSQPDLNWETKAMRLETYKDMQFWLKKGCDGFRIDSMNLMSKDPKLPDADITNPGVEFQNGSKYFASGPRIHEYIREMRIEVFDKYDAMIVGELGFTNDEASVEKYIAPSRKELNCLFTGDYIDQDFGPEFKYGYGEFTLQKLRVITCRWQSVMKNFDGWNTVYMDNHDSGRSLSRYASDKPAFRKSAAKMLATYMCTLSGSLFLLQGQEIGMANIPESWGLEEYIDVEAKNWYSRILKERGDGADMSDVLQEMRLKSRDNGRLPMQWDSTANAGFSTTKPWMRVNDDFEEWNVKSQLQDNDSVLAFWKEMLALRKKEKDVFVYGTFTMLDENLSGETIFAYTMASEDGSRRALVLLNFSEMQQEFPGASYCEWRHLAGGTPGSEIDNSGLMMKPYEGTIFCNWE
jgi:oligo-1,6-glucosidase